MSDLEAMRARLMRLQFYAIFMEPPEPLDDPLPVFGSLLRDHIAFLKDLEDRGILFVSGPFSSGSGDWRGDGMAIVRAASLEAAQAIAADEPLHRAGIRQNRVRPWQLNEGGFSMTVRFFASDYAFT